MVLFIFLTLSLLFSLLIIFIMGSSLLGLARTHVPFVPTAVSDIIQVGQRLPIEQNDVFVDLGSGDGRVIFEIEKLTGAKVRGYELTLWTHLLTRLKKSLRGSHAELIWGDFFKANLTDATVVYCYLYPPLMRAVGEKILAECKKGTHVVSRDFPIPNLEKLDYWKSSGKHEIFVYKIQ